MIDAARSNIFAGWLTDISMCNQMMTSEIRE